MFWILGAIASFLGFGVDGIVKHSCAAHMMSAAWTSGIGVSIISHLQSWGALFGQAAAFMHL